MSPKTDNISNFFENPTIRHLADSPRWTISGKLHKQSENNKTPINIRAYAENRVIRGATKPYHNCLLPLSQVVRLIPSELGYTFYLNASVDNVLVLDIEPGCPKQLTEQLLTPPALYREQSSSGQGYHLLLPLPDDTNIREQLLQRKVLRETHGWYEYLIEHWVIFTGKPIPDSLYLNATNQQPFDLDATYRKLLAETHTRTQKAYHISPAKPKIPGETEIIKLIVKNPILKHLDDFDGDNSRFEFSVLSILYHRLKSVIPYVSEKYSHNYLPVEKAWLIYEAAKQTIPHRAKHDRLRNKLPLLLYSATKIVT